MNLPNSSAGIERKPGESTRTGERLPMDTGNGKDSKYTPAVLLTMLALVAYQSGDDAQNFAGGR